MKTPAILVLIIISILIFKGVQNGSIQFTAKKFILGLIITVVIINVILVFIM
ncbi:hypothetical protein J2Y67_004969 [Neobacillus niacini]|nr:hypothetical protein [Neobacillus niacini]